MGEVKTNTGPHDLRRRVKFWDHRSGVQPRSSLEAKGLQSSTDAQLGTMQTV